MKQLTLSTVCMIAALGTVPALAAPAGKDGGRKPAGDTECTYMSPDKRGDVQKNRERSSNRRSTDCIVVKGYPSQDGRAALRRSLQDEAKEGLGRTVRFNLKSLIGKKPTS